MKSAGIFIILLFSIFPVLGEKITLISPHTEEEYQVSVLNEEELNKHFNYLATRNTINYDILFDGCFERTYVMVSISRLKNIELGKVVVDVTNKDKEVIEVLSDDKRYKLRWYYHVAPFVYVRDKNNNLSPRVIDPALFDKAVTLRGFKERLVRDNPRVKVKSLLLPKYVGDEKQLLKNVNLSALDRKMTQGRMEIYNQYLKAGAYHENIPFYDSLRDQWYQGGHPVDAP